METKSQTIQKAAIEEDLVVRLLESGEDEAIRLIALLDSMYFSHDHSLAFDKLECKWTNYTEQKACFSKFVPWFIEPMQINGGRVFFVPIYGPDEILEFKADSLFRLIDLLLDVDWFVICGDDAVPALIQRRYGVMELFLAK